MKKLKMSECGWLKLTISLFYSQKTSNLGLQNSVLKNKRSFNGIKSAAFATFAKADKSDNPTRYQSMPTLLVKSISINRLISWIKLVTFKWFIIGCVMNIRLVLVMRNYQKQMCWICRHVGSREDRNNRNAVLTPIWKINE